MFFLLFFKFFLVFFGILLSFIGFFSGFLLRVSVFKHFGGKMSEHTCMYIHSRVIVEKPKNTVKSTKNPKNKKKTTKTKKTQT